MATHYTTEELSAYLDGEHADSGAVEQHLQTCRDCAAQHRSLADLSAQMRAIPDPEVTHGFTDRVMRACAEPATVSFRPRFRFLTPLVATAATIAAGVFGYVALTASEFEAIDYRALQQEAIVGDEELIMAQADERPSQAVPDEYFAGRDYSETLVSLNEDEKDTLMMLLATSLLDDQQI